MDVEQRLQGIAAILAASNERMDPKSNRSTHETGFLPLHPRSFSNLALALSEKTLPRRLSLDLLCGNGGWALMTAAMGIPSYGIDINALLVEEARANHGEAVDAGLIDPDTPCAFATGNIFVGADYEAYIADAERENSSGRYSPRYAVGDPYAELGVSIGEAGVIYAFCWSGGLPFLCQVLARDAGQDTLFVLPNFDHGNEWLPLQSVTAIPGPYQLLARNAG